MRRIAHPSFLWMEGSLAYGLKGGPPFLKPFPGVLPIRHRSRDLPPEAGGMVHFPKMSHFVGGNVVERERRRADKSP